MNRLTSLALATLLLAPLAALHAADVTNLRCEYRENPLGIDVVKPCLLSGLHLAGRDGDAYKRIRIEPVARDGLTWAKADYDSIHGRIASHWKREGDQLTMEVSIPPNTTATIHVPAKDLAAVIEFGKPAAELAGVKFLRMENNAGVYAVGSGTYRFQSTLMETIK